MDSRSATLDAGTARLDERARVLGRAVLAGELSERGAAGQVLAEAVETGVVARMCARHHRGLAAAWDIDEITSAVTSMLVAYALPSPDRDGRLDVTRFADGDTSASGWVGKVIGAMRATRVLREMHAEPAVATDTDTLEQVPAPGAPEQGFAPEAADLEARTKGLPAASDTVRLIHASALHDLLGLPPLRSWDLTPAQRDVVLEAVGQNPGMLASGLPGSTTDAPITTFVAVLWDGWSREDVAAMLAATTAGRDIPHLLCQAALQPLPRPRTRCGDLDRIRARARDAVPAHARPAVARVLEAFLEAEVAVHTDFDRIRRPLTDQQRSRRDESQEALPGLLEGAAGQLGVTRWDVLSGLTGLFTEQLAIVETGNFTPTTWRFP
ncbi:MAG: hypothetical protein L0G46_09980 [Kocuria sp.]|nr:hypothetical protein [Kocuria sp.]